MSARLVAPRLSLLALPLLALSGCTIWALVNSDPDGLPCADEEPACLAGYACVEQDDGQRLCRKVAVGEEGADCVADSECKEGLVCRDFYETACEPNDPDVNCQLGLGQGRKCRSVCDPNQAPAGQCPGGQRCFVPSNPEDTVTGWCQKGTCELNSHCGTNPANNVDNICVAPQNPPGPSGLCAMGCNPLNCNPTAGCGGCPVDQAGCEPFGDLGLAQFGCVPPGTAGYTEPCDGVNVFCQAGSFCFITDNGAGFCSQFCNAQGGAPACEGGLRCNPITAQVGFCG